MSFHQRKGGDFKSFHKSRDMKAQRRKGHGHTKRYNSDAFDYSSVSKQRKEDTSKTFSREKSAGKHKFLHKGIKQKYVKWSSSGMVSRSEMTSNSESEDISNVHRDDRYNSTEDERDQYMGRVSYELSSGLSTSAGAAVSTESNSDDSGSDAFDSGALADDDVEEMTEEPEEKSSEYEKLKKELADIPLEDLMKVKEKIGLKVFNKIMHGGKGKSPKQKKTFKRENKNRPREMTAKRQVPVVRHMDNISQKHRFHRDPRFDDLSGEYKDEYFEKNYSFLDEIKNKEKKMVKKELKKTKEITKKKDLQGLLMRMNQQDQVRENKRKKKAIEATWKSKEKELVKQGKLPYFLKKSVKKKLELAEKYKELQKSGKLDQYLSKKRKKNAQRERKKLPQQMNSRS